MSLIKVSDIYDNKRLKKALTQLGDYVYAYYEPDKIEPFYIGLGVRERVLSHWKNAIKEPTKRQELRIRELLEDGRYPLIRLLAYNLESTCEKPNALVERVLIETFGIDTQERLQFDGTNRLKNHTPTLLQEKNENKKTPPLSIEAALCQIEPNESYTASRLQEWCDDNKTALLVVGLSKTYKTSYIQTELAEMARMYWNLEKFSNTTLPKLKAAKRICLLGWSSKANLNSSTPYIVGAWTSNGNRLSKNSNGANARYVLNVDEDIAVKQQFIGATLAGAGNNWQGPRVFIPHFEES
ncbi:hypothetical protein AMBAS45_16355 [Alteromonas macleodii str. 'Balearic Sea AD45']|uniref:hypothetical protein n=1 Tax=Alteromonas macleodii TaxID=28108 RepID=UPI000286FDFE|nr:hypothetical protein [Alteromonas macleodii]AFT96732.1 hypothetical protein AMBAS45_16355 [Alteromonas macleodii str. 'Balearic Sea AD45']HCV01200.1 hypothetical protein [Pseudoalteromonas sp.]|tara:strand:+ start:404 stop:1294 length:891 start_codon:yes stop_codon:yes gene_type:complete